MLCTSLSITTQAITAEADTESDYEELVSSVAHLYRWIDVIGDDRGNSSFLESCILSYSNCQENDR